jgi:beta-glucosidase
MNMVRLLKTSLLAAVTTCYCGAAPATSRVKELLSRMTLEEKVGQMTQVDMHALTNADDVRKYCLGSVLSGGDSDPQDISARGWLSAVNAFKAQAMKTRLKIPLLYGIDAVHGHNNVDGAVIFPHNIGLGATGNPDLIERAARATAEEVAGTGIRWAFAPCVAVVQNDRWGRTYEGFGDDPELVSKCGTAAVRGLQQAETSSGSSVLACAKHFVGDGGTLNGQDQGDTVCDERTLRERYLAPYAAAVKAGAGSVMISYNSWNGKKMHGNKHLITDVLKDELGFEGFVVSDWAAIDQLGGSYKADVEKSINAGLDMIMVPAGPGEKNNYADFIHRLIELVKEGKVPQARVDDAVRRILTQKERLGLFDGPETPARLTDGVGSAAHRQVARECVRQSLVLLKNAQDTLPLSRSGKRICVVGKAASDLGVQCGGWTISWQGKSGEVTHGGTTILEAIRATVSDHTEVVFSPDGASLPKADVTIVVVGEQPYAEMKGDTRDLWLPAQELELIRKSKAAGSRTVTLLISGRPLILGSALENSDALIAAWLPGTEGRGVTDVLFGDYKPTGKLPRNWPRNNEQLAGKPTVSVAPQFPRGFGLSYGPAIQSSSR